MTPANTEALVAEWQKKATAEASRRNSAYDYYGMDNTPESVDPLGAKMAAELRRLSAENEALQRKVQEQALQALTDGTENAELLAERDALRADAERYRWLREQHEGHEELAFDADGLPMPPEPTALAFTVFHPKDGGLEPVGCIPGELDAAIDAARAAMKGTQ